MSNNTKQLIQDFVDYLMPALTPYESSLYVLLLRLTFLKDGTTQVRIGKRTISERFGTGSQGAEISFAHVTKVLKNLESKGCIIIGDTVRDGTIYTVVQPCDIPLVKEKNAAALPIDHYVPQSKGGTHSKANLRTCCFVCNSIKSGKSFDEAAPFILKSIQERKQKQNK